MSDQSHKRHILKAVTWRVVGTMDTMLLAWWISGNPMTGLKIGVAEVLTKMLLYYLHERLWYKINLSENGLLRESRKRHLAKTLTWRVVGTMDTMLISWFITGNPWVGVQIGVAELLTKMLLYYFHERVWYRVSFGLNKRQNTSENGQ
ncbi:DUF2061 domain-containing protein [Planktosalinus lacus]|uniref:DUF2061 domain-containing protein n=1 Tax=Planktosalinus lacus TaxID=1526573 RepID=A0A8J2Y8S4_9FLAO|nr:DUF2061 domain-containing protein [Planktosalinus lacus]GGD85008.1 hypothetical protein GCM10011312_06340 [Planktosalinus lacus]